MVKICYLSSTEKNGLPTLVIHKGHTLRAWGNLLKNAIVYIVIFLYYLLEPWFLNNDIFK